MAEYWDARAAEGWVPQRHERTPPPGIERENERLAVRAELDALVARDLFRLTADEMDYVLTTFPSWRQREIKEYGEFRTRRLVLEAWETLPTPTQAVRWTPDWLDKPLAVPAAPRGQVRPDRYRALVVPQLVYQAGGRIDFEKLRRAYWLLTEPKRLQKYATDTLGATAKQWATSFRDKLEKDKFIPHLKGAINRDFHLTKKDGCRWAELRRLENVIHDEHVIFDARLALLVADLWPSEDPIATLSAEEEKILMEMEAAS